jgi:hypothetical protein
MLKWQKRNETWPYSLDRAYHSYDIGLGNIQSHHTRSLWLRHLLSTCSPHNFPFATIVKIHGGFHLNNNKKNETVNFNALWYPNDV